MRQILMYLRAPRNASGAYRVFQQFNLLCKICFSSVLVHAVIPTPVQHFLFSNAVVGDRGCCRSKTASGIVIDCVSTIYGCASPVSCSDESISDQIVGLRDCPSNRHFASNASIRAVKDSIVAIAFCNDITTTAKTERS